MELRNGRACRLMLPCHVLVVRTVPARLPARRSPSNRSRHEESCGFCIWFISAMVTWHLC